MKKKILVLNIHSFVDIITNSSTELFVGDSKKSIEAIEEIIQEFLDSLAKIDDSKPQKVDDILTISMIDESNVEEHLEDLLNYDVIPRFIKDLKGKYKPIDWNNYCSEEDDKRKERNENWKSQNWVQLKSQLLGKIVIIGTVDNSIPYDLFYIIQYRLLDCA
jgi:hypothetical protein